MSDDQKMEQEIREWICEQLAMLLEKDPIDLDPDKPLEDLDVISLDVVHVIAGAMKQFSIKVPRSAFEGHDTINKLAGLIASHAD